ncbi:hypothetical protein M5K25_022548 [Dendrobium thyrsiflorum]|uniref:Uncharacterized protein n=1 Tax=Dendrobium thyrsiflorum TaxID=117978 RepID=A0ABD0U6G3_DENTH
MDLSPNLRSASLVPIEAASPSLGQGLWRAKGERKLLEQYDEGAYICQSPPFIPVGVLRVEPHSPGVNRFTNKYFACVREKVDIAWNHCTENPSENIESISDCGHLKRPVSTTSVGRRKKIFGSTFLRNQITQLVNSCTNITSETNASKTNSTSETSSISAAIKVLEQTTEVFEDMQLYLFSTKFLEDPTKRENFYVNLS